MSGAQPLEREMPSAGSERILKAMETEPVSSLVQGPAVTIGPEATIQEAVECLQGMHIGCVLVAGSDGKLAGIFTERDLLNRVAGRRLSWRATRSPSISSWESPCSRSTSTECSPSFGARLPAGVESAGWERRVPSGRKAPRARCWGCPRNSFGSRTGSRQQSAGCRRETHSSREAERKSASTSGASEESNPRDSQSGLPTAAQNADQNFGSSAPSATALPSLQA